MLFHPLKNDRGLALLFVVLLFTAAATASITFISLAVKVKGIQGEGTTQLRLDEIRTALQNYYLIHYDLPEPSLTNPPNSVPTDLLNLPQRYRFDSNGQMVFYDRFPASGHMTTIRNVHVHGANDENLVAAVLVAPGPDKSFSSSNQASPYADPSSAANDDIVLAVSLEAEAIKIANHTVAVLQQAAKVYDSIFEGINNDADTLFMPPVESLSDTGWTPGTEWFDYTEPVSHSADFDCSGGANSGEWTFDDPCYSDVGSTTVTLPDGSTVVTPNGECVRIPVNPEIWYPNYADDPLYSHCPSGNVYIDGTVPDNDEDVVPRPILDVDNSTPVIADGDMSPLETPVPLIDEGEQVDSNADGITDSYDAYPAATGGSGQGCIRYGVLTNDPNRGVFSLDNCSSGTPAYDLAVVYGLNLLKLGFDLSTNSLLDPWGNPYRWGGAGSIYPQPIYSDPIEPDIDADGNYDKDDDVLRDFHYWSFYSMGPDGLSALGVDGRPGTADDETPDDILPSADRIPGYFLTLPIANPIP